MQRHLTARRLATAGWIIGAALGASPAAAQALSQLYVEVLDGVGRPVTNMTAADFTVTEDDTEVEIVSAELGDDPMRIALLVDSGDRINEAGALNSLRSGLAAFLDTLPPQHEISLLTIARNIQRRTDFTTDRAELKSEAGLIFAERGAGAVLLDGVRETWERRFEDDEPFPVFVLVLTDGTEASGHYNDDEYVDLVDTLRASEVTVHTVLLSTRGGSVVSQYALNLTQNTGGLYTNIAAPTGLADALAQLATQIGVHWDEVSQRYRIVYQRPDPPGASISLAVTRSGVGVRLFADRRIPQ